MSIVVINSRSKLLTFIILSVPIDIDVVLPSRLVPVDFLAPAVVHREIHTFDKPGAMRALLDQINRAALTIATFVNDITIAVCAEHFVAMVTVWCKHIRKLIIG